MISFVVPAHNEQACLGKTLQAIHDAAHAVGQPYEIIVVDDDSTDATAETARQHSATVLAVNHRQIAATRNSGARAASGDRLFFVDADTIINPRAVASALRYMDRGAAGGGAPALFDSAAPAWARLLLWLLGWYMRVAGLSGGAFMFCTRDAFHAVGGFDERLFGAEDAAMSWALKREGRFVLIWNYVRTSGRRMHGMSGLRMLALMFQMAFFPRMLRRRSAVKKVWYDSHREVYDNTPVSLAVQLFHALMLVIVLVIVIAWLPIGIVIPWSWTPPGSLLSEIRYAIAIFSCHIGIVMWPCLYFLCCSLFRQKRWIERIKFAALIALCLWLAWGGTCEVIRFWRDLL